MTEDPQKKELTPPARFAGSGVCLAADARSLARFLRGRHKRRRVSRGWQSPRFIAWLRGVAAEVDGLT
jgi:hypothetical protein